MRKILAFLLSLIIAYTPALLFAADIDFNNRYQTGPWKIDTSKGVNPYNTGGSGQTDYLNTSKYNVQAQRQVTKNGTSSTQKASVTVTTSKEELKTTIANRAKNLGKYAKNLGKASVPALVGSAALTGILEGIGWIMDEGGQIQLPTTPEQQQQYDLEQEKYTSPHMYKIAQSMGSFPNEFYSPKAACIGYAAKQSAGGASVVYISNTNSACTLLWTRSDGTTSYVGGTVAYLKPNPDYNPTYQPQPMPVTIANPQQIGQAVAEALESNNPALADAIAKAVKDAFVESPLDTDPDTKEKIAPLPKKTTDALDAVADPQLEPEDTSLPLPPEGTPDNSVIEKPQIGEDGSLPDSCDWFNFLCKWTEWTKEEPDLDKDTKLEIEEKEFDTSIFSKSRFGVPDQCPAPVEHTLEVTGITTSFSFDLSPLCDVLSFAKPALIACSYLYAAYIVIGAARNG